MPAHNTVSLHKRPHAPLDRGMSCVLRMCNDVHAAVSKSSASALADVQNVQAQSMVPLVFNTQAVAGDMAAAAKRFDEHAGGMLRR